MLAVQVASGMMKRSQAFGVRDTVRRSDLSQSRSGRPDLLGALDKKSAAKPKLDREVSNLLPTLVESTQ